VRRGFAVSGVVWDGGRVAGVRARAAAGARDAAAEQVFEAAHVIGDDGAKSAVREACGIPLRPKSAPVDLLCFEADPPGEGKPLAGPAVGRVWINPHWGRSGMFLLGAVALPGGRAVGLVPARPRLLDDPVAAARAWQDLLEASPGAADVRPGLRLPGDAVRVRMAYGHAARYGVPGAFLIGDAAHPVTPAGGQGANLAVADAVSLAAAVRGGAPDSDVLEAYERERRPAASRSMRLSRGAALGLSLPDRLLGALAPAVFGLLGRADAGWLGRLVSVPATLFQTRSPRWRIGRIACPAWAGGCEAPLPEWGRRPCRLRFRRPERVFNQRV
jgi:2-polyprenyl-6-methoxyphenol hydroxylase-like FAD-dependent oxidoreductase